VSGEGKCDRWIAGFDMCTVDEACESEVRVCTRMILDFRLVKTEGATSAEQLSHYMLDRSQVEVFVHVYRTQSACTISGTYSNRTAGSKGISKPNSDSALPASGGVK
jgi:hypothetical protein